MYQVKYGESFIKPGLESSYAISTTSTPDTYYKTKRDAERGRTKRAQFSSIPISEYKIVQVTSPTKTGKVSTEDLVDKLLTAITAEYKDDRPTAGIVFSKLPDGQVYGSVVRYNQPGGYSGVLPKTVVAKSTKATVRAAIIDLSQTWLQKNVAKNALENALKGA